MASIEQQWVNASSGVPAEVIRHVEFGCHEFKLACSSLEIMLSR